MVCNEYASDEGVEYASPDEIVECFLLPNDPYYWTSGTWGQPYDDLWGLKKVRCAEAWDLSAGSGVTIAVTDTGVWYRLATGNPYHDGHPDIKPNMWINWFEYEGPPYYAHRQYDDDQNGYVDDVWGWNFVEAADEQHPDPPYSDPEDSADTDPMDFMGHGTHVAGTTSAVGNNGIGVIGVAPYSRVMNVKCFNRKGLGLLSWGAEAIEYAAGNGAAPVFRYTPAALKRTITVAASDHEDVRAAFSNFGVLLDVAAPGGDARSDPPETPPEQHHHWGSDVLSLRSTNTDMCCRLQRCGKCIIHPPGALYGLYRANGTSMACPHVAGAAALVLQVMPYLNPEGVRQAIRRGAVDLGDPGFDQYYGFGRLDARAALDEAYNYPCGALLLQPSDQTFYFLGRGEEINVYGIADGAYMSYWEVCYAKLYDQSTWIPVASDDYPKAWPQGAYLCSIPVDGMSGQAWYLIRLTVHGYYGSWRTYYDYVSVNVAWPK